jgi:predicted amidohydrolase
LVSRYDKRLCSHSELNGWYSPGDMPVVFDVDGIRFGAAICIELQFPELFLEYARLGVDCVLFSAYSGDPMYGIEAQAHAALNNYWLSLSTPAQCNHKLPSGLIGPDGYYLAKGSSDLKAGFTCGEINRGDVRYAIALNKARPWRAAVRAGDLHASPHVHDERSDDRTSF